MRASTILLALCLASVAVLAGCTSAGSCSGAQGMLGQNSVCNHKDSFSYGSQGSLNTKTDSYAWENSKTKAQVAIGGQLSSGSMKITIKDAAGATVYTKTIQGAGQSGGSEGTTAGKAGTWTITIDLKAATGQLGLSVTASA